MNATERKSLARRTLFFTTIVSAIYALLICLDIIAKSDSVDLGLKAIPVISRWYDLIYWFFSILLLVRINMAPNLELEKLKNDNKSSLFGIVASCYTAIITGMIVCGIVGSVFGVIITLGIFLLGLILSSFIAMCENKIFKSWFKNWWNGL